VTDSLSDDELAFLQSMFDLARAGDATLLENVDAGLPVNLTNGSGDTLLILAAYHTHPELVRGLVERGADHSRVNDRGQTALASAVFRQSRDIVTTLLDAGADPDLGPKSAVDIAEFFDLPDMLSLLRR
jgi:ankyrin repeat protein